MNFYVGAQFPSFEEFESRLEQYQDQVFANYVIDSSAILAPNGDKITSEVVERFKYKRLYYICKMGGSRKEQASYARRISTYKRKCPSKFSVSFKETANGFALQILSLVLSHNHELKANLYRAMPKQRRKVIEDARPLLDRVLNTKPDYKLLQFDLSSSNDGGVVKRKDLYNYNTKIKNSFGGTEMEQIVNELLSLDGACVKVVHDAENAVQGIFFQDARMQNVFNAYPEILLFDGTYSLNNRRMPLVILLTIDGYGETQVIALFLVISENLDIFTTMFQLFKTENPNWDKIEVVLTDKAMVNLAVVAKELPNAAHQLCIFHAMQSFNREITTVKRQISNTQRDACLKIVKKLVYSKSQAEYDEKYKELLALNCKSKLNIYLCALKIISINVGIAQTTKLLVYLWDFSCKAI